MYFLLKIFSRRFPLSLSSPNINRLTSFSLTRYNLQYFTAFTKSSVFYQDKSNFGTKSSLVFLAAMPTVLPWPSGFEPDNLRNNTTRNNSGIFWKSRINIGCHVLTARILLNSKDESLNGDSQTAIYLPYIPLLSPFHTISPFFLSRITRQTFPSFPSSISTSSIILRMLQDIEKLLLIIRGRGLNTYLFCFLEIIASES